MTRENASPEAAAKVLWHSLGPEAVLDLLKTDPAKGLDGAEASKRRERYGPNALESGKRPAWYALFARQFTDALVIILMVAAAAALALGETADAVTILAIVVLNGVLGFAQEWKAENAIEALKRMLSPRCRVVRDGVEKEIDSSEVVPGDMVVLETGARVPADIRLIETVNLKADESSLTGESESVDKGATAVDGDAALPERGSMAWAGTVITSGRGMGAVVATGMESEFGRIARLTGAVAAEKTPFQKKLATLGKGLGALSLAVSAAVAASGLLLGKPLFEMFLVGVSLAVAVVPEGLPAVVTVTLALGIRSMVRRKALMRRLPAVETLGSATVICTDKTGTLTENEMTVQRIWLPSGLLAVTGAGYDPTGLFEVDGNRIDPGARPGLMELLETGTRCNSARLYKDENGWHKVGEPTEAALLVAGRKAGLHPEGPFEAVGEFSFTSERKRMTVVERKDGALTAHIKGAPEVIMARSARVLDGGDERAMTEAERRSAEAAYEAMSGEGLRTLALARRTLPDEDVPDEDEVENGLTLLGIVGIIDPPRPEVPGAVRLAYGAGIGVIMITGDSPSTALAVARQTGLRSARAVTGPEMEGMDDETLGRALAEEAVFARTAPEHKLRIVTLLKKMGHIVGMTGDGVNDSPALKKADIGIAMGLRGTDVAREAADMVLTDDNFASIVGAVEEGRRQYDNVQKFVRYLLSSNTGEVLAILVNILAGGPLILLPAQILWMNLVTDGMTAVALGLEPPEKSLMMRPPRRPAEPILNATGAGTILLLGAYIGGVTLWVFHHYGGAEGSVVAQTAAFTGIIILEQINVFNFRALGEPIIGRGLFSNPWVLLACAASLGLQAGAVYLPFMQKAFHTVPLALSDWAVLFALSVPAFFASEAVKWLLRRRGR